MTSCELKTGSDCVLSVIFSDLKVTSDRVLSIIFELRTSTLVYTLDFSPVEIEEGVN